jgi:hypothetical protein
MSEEEVRIKNSLNSIKRLLAANRPFPFFVVVVVVVVVEVISGLADRAYVREEKLVVIDQIKAGTGCNDVGGCSHVGYGSDLLRVRAASVFVDDEPVPLY